MPFNETFFGKGHVFNTITMQRTLDISERMELPMLEPYQDKSKFGPKWAIGLGHVEGGDIEPKVIDPAVLGYRMKLTLEQVRAIHVEDIEHRAKWLRKKIKVPVTNYMFGGLELLVMNVGFGNLAKGRVLPFLNAGKYVSAGAAFMDHRFMWVPVKDEEGKPVQNLDTGKPLMQRVEDVGLIFRRAIEIEMFGTKVN